MANYIIGLFLANGALWLGMYWKPKNDGVRLLRDILCFAALCVGIITMGRARENTAYKSALDGDNPYHKEYVYRVLPDETKELTDSIYVK